MKKSIDGTKVEFDLTVTQEGDVIAVRARQQLTGSRIELESVLTVNGSERYRRAWQRPWRCP